MSDTASSGHTSPSVFEYEHSPWDVQSLTDSVGSITSVESDDLVAGNDLQGEDTMIGMDASPINSPGGSPLPTPLMFSERDPLASPSASITHPTLPPTIPGVSTISRVSSPALPSRSIEEGQSKVKEKPATSWYELHEQMNSSTGNGPPTGRERMLIGEHFWQVMNAIENHVRDQSPQMKREDSGRLEDPLIREVCDG